MVEVGVRSAQPELAPAQGSSGGLPVLTRDQKQRRTQAVHAAARALKLAGLTLAPEQRELGDLQLARMLLREAFVRAVQAIADQERLATVSEAREALDGCATLPAKFTGPLASDNALELESSAPLPIARLRELEAWVVDLTRWAEQKPRRRFGPRWLAAGVVALIAAVVVLAPQLGGKPSWVDFTWRASSAYGTYPITGMLGDSKDELVFHTASEPAPWVLIDMHEPRSIHEIILKNRRDCCFERGLPLVVELSLDAQSFTLAGRKDNVFEAWPVRFEPQLARYVRLRSEANTHLHLAQVAIR